MERDRAAAAHGGYPFSYIETLWDDGYLDYDEPCPVNVAPGFTSKRLDPAWPQPLVAAKLARTCAKWFIGATEGSLPVPWYVSDKKPGDPVCIAGMPVQMGFCRTPGALRDAVHIAESPELALRYVTVLRNGHIFLVSLVNQTGHLRSERSLAKGFETVIAATSVAQTGPAAHAEHPVPALTTSNRRDWFKSRQRLKDADPGNAVNLRYIENSLMVICLDDFESAAAASNNSGSSKSNVYGTLCATRLENNLVGHDRNRGNRWFDKHQIVVTPFPGEGFGFTAEHAFSDGIAWSKWINLVYDDIMTGGKALPEPSANFLLVNHNSSSTISSDPASTATAAPSAPSNFAASPAGTEAAADATTTITAAAAALVAEVKSAAATAVAAAAPAETVQQSVTATTPSPPCVADMESLSVAESKSSEINHHQHQADEDDDALLEQPVTEVERANHRRVKIREEPAGTDAGNGVIHLQFNLPDATKKEIAAAVSGHAAACSNLVQVPVQLPFGKSHCKRSLKVGPDALCQASFHLAYARLHGQMGAAYESCSTEKFFHGRTETIRSATPEMNAWVRSMMLPSSSSSSSAREEQIAKLFDATVAHGNVAREAANGQGIDRHLLALKSIVKELADPAGLAFFSEKLYGSTGTWVLSTSNVSQPAFEWFSFGPVTHAGYGLGYVVHEENVNVGLSAFRDNETTCAEEMAQQIMRAAEDVVALMTERSKRK